MSHHPDEPLVEIVGIEASNRGRSCEAHDVCGDVLAVDSVVRFRTTQIQNGTYNTVTKCQHTQQSWSHIEYRQTQERKKQQLAYIG